MPATMVDLSFPLRGSSLPREHRRALVLALLERLPWLAEVPGAGVHRINAATGTGERALLSGRSRLTLRLPRDQAADASALIGSRLDLGDAAIDLPAPPAVRELLPHGTLYAHAVQAGGSDEVEFLAVIDVELAALGVSCRTICGRSQRLLHDDAGQASFSLMLDGLGVEHALRVLDAGLGPNRLFGCGLFVPHRSAAAVGH